MTSPPVDPAPWNDLTRRLSEAARLLSSLRKEFLDRLDFKHYSKLQVAETTVEKLASDVQVVFESLMAGPVE